MKNPFRTLMMIFAVAIAFPMAAYAADYQKGFAAFKRGDYAVAIKEWKPFAEQGNASAQYNLGLMYQNGWGVRQDYGEALKWFRRAAEQGNSQGQDGLGSLYRNGRGVQKDYKESVRWYQLAAQQGNDVALKNLGDMYFNGFCVPQDYATAARHYKPASELGRVDAQVTLGFLYFHGRGVPKNYIRAHMWTNLAASKRSSKAIKNLIIFEKNMTPSQRAEAQRLASEWKPKSPQKPKTVQQAREAPPRTPPKQIARAAPEPASEKKTSSMFNNDPIKVRFPTSRPQPDDIAVIIGNANYEKQGTDIPNVNPAYADAEGIKRYFTQALGVKEGNIIYLRDATGSQLTGVFGNKENHKGKLFNWVRPSRSNVYVYYAGHGAPAGQDGSALIVPSDSSAETIELTGYSLTTLYKNLGKIPAKSVTVILEACFSGASQGGTVIPNASPVYLKAKAPTIPSNITVISAGSANQMASWEQDKNHSLFTKYFLKGMSGEADVSPFGNGDGKVNNSELEKYLDDTMTYFARRYYGRSQKVQIVNGG